jgi:hypothetical protein
VTQTEPEIVKNFHGARVEEAGWLYTIPITQQHESHYIKEFFEIDPMEYSSDIKLPYWWIVKYGVLSGVTAEHIIHQFPLKHCNQH